MNVDPHPDLNACLVASRRAAIIELQRIAEAAGWTGTIRTFEEMNHKDTTGLCINGVVITSVLDAAALEALAWRPEPPQAPPPLDPAEPMLRADYRFNQGETAMSRNISTAALVAAVFAVWLLGAIVAKASAQTVIVPMPADWAAPSPTVPATPMAPIIVTPPPPPIVVVPSGPRSSTICSTFGTLTYCTN